MSLGGVVFEDAGSSSMEMGRARAGQPTMMRLIKSGGAAAMFAARLPTVPVIRAAHGSQPDRPAVTTVRERP